VITREAARLYAERSVTPGQVFLHDDRGLVETVVSKREAEQAEADRKEKETTELQLKRRNALLIPSINVPTTLSGMKRSQQAPDTLTGIVDRDGPLKVSFFGLPHLVRIQPPHEVAENGLKVASLVDLAGTKAHVVQARAEAKDYMDIDALIRVGKIDLPTSLAAAQAIFGPDFNPQITLKALSFFDEGNLRGLPDDMKSCLVTAARDVDLDKLPDLAVKQQRDMSRGHKR
jgi:hypothetical protein